jgi:ABC-type phosphate transport system, permease component
MTRPAEKHRRGLTSARPRRGEQFISLALRLCAYFALLAAGVIFVHIALRGAPVVLQASPPFLNLSFLTGHPQTLHVYQPRELAAEVEALRRTLQGTEPAMVDGDHETREALTIRFEELQNRLEEESLLYSDDALRALRDPPGETNYVYSNFAYSAGGIGTAIVGTLLLVAGSICISLLLGVSSATSS